MEIINVKQDILYDYVRYTFILCQSKMKLNNNQKKEILNYINYFMNI